MMSSDFSARRRQLVAALLAWPALTAARTESRAAALRIAVYNPPRRHATPSTSVLVFGRRDAVLIDAQLRASETRQLVEMVRQGRKRLVAVLVTANAPDHYFGLQALHEAFPDTRIVAPEAIVDGIRRDAPLALAQRAPDLGTDAPSQLRVPDPLQAQSITLEDSVLEIRLPAATEPFVWMPALRAVLGGPAVSGLGRHVSTLEQPGPAARRQRLDALAAIAALQPRVVVPGRFLPGTPMTAATVQFTRDYLTAFEIERVRSASADALAAAMLARYPGLADEAALVASARLAKMIDGAATPLD